MIRCADYIASWAASPLAALGDAPWHLTSRAAEVVAAVAAGLEGYERRGEAVLVHPGVRVEDGAVILGPAIVGPGCFLARNSLVRGGCRLEEECVIGPGVELKSSFLFRSAALAHLNFVGDSIVGAGVNLEAGAIVANRRNEADGAPVAVVVDGQIIATGAEKFGALIGDGAKVGANAVLAPGTILPPRTIVERLALVDQVGAPLAR